ncbi:hypothetical protein HK101_008202 [Irineochytrium annulatum]|nr:hypothetical protein HK101_008202 [Irineochytrium annulatum]
MHRLAPTGLLALLALSAGVHSSTTTTTTTTTANSPGGPTAAPEKPSIANPDGYSSQYRLAWSDDFEVFGLDASKWAAEEGKAIRGPAWVSPSNVRAENGLLHLDVKRESIKDNKGNFATYTVGRAVSKRSFGMGYYEARLRVPRTEGFEASFSLWTKSETRATTELMIAELSTEDPRIYSGGVVVHTAEKQAESRMPGCDIVRVGDLASDKLYLEGKPAPMDFSSDFQTVGVEWRELDQTIRYFLNGEGVAIQQWPSTAPKFTEGALTLEVRVPGWSEVDDSAMAERQSVLVDYVAYYNVPLAGTPAAAAAELKEAVKSAEALAAEAAKKAADDAALQAADLAAQKAADLAADAARLAAEAARLASNPGVPPASNAAKPVIQDKDDEPQQVVTRSCAHCSGTPINLYSCPRQRFTTPTNLIGGQTTDATNAQRAKNGDLVLLAVGAPPGLPHQSVTLAPVGKCYDGIAAGGVSALEIVARVADGVRFEVEVWDLAPDCREKGARITVEPTKVGGFDVDAGFNKYMVPLTGTTLTLSRLGGYNIKNIHPATYGTSITIRCTSFIMNGKAKFVVPRVRRHKRSSVLDL